MKSRNMARPRNVEDVFNKVQQTYLNSPIQKEGSNKRWAFMEELLDNAQQTYHSMSDVTIIEYHRYYLRRNAHEKQEEIEQPKTIPEQFWNAAYSFDPLNTPAGTVSDTQRELSRRNLESVPLGRYGGMNNARLKLIPDIGALPNLRCAATDSGAISYPDGHPSVSPVLARSFTWKVIPRPGLDMSFRWTWCWEGSSFLVRSSV